MLVSQRGFTFNESRNFHLRKTPNVNYFNFLPKTFFLKFECYPPVFTAL